jgi:beta-galactosidase
MTQLTRRNLLKTGLAASAGLIATDNAFYVPEAEAATAGTQSHPALSTSLDGVYKQVSSRERLLLDFGWRFHLGDANDAAKDFRWGAPTREGTFSKAGQDWLHNKSDGSLQHSFDDSAWRVVDLPHDWAVELPFVKLEKSEISVNAAHGGKGLGREFPATSIGWYERTFDMPATDEGRRISLDFDGVFRDSIVLFNGFYLGRNLSGYAPFSFDITDYVKYGGKNVVTVRVDATFNEGWYYEGAGIYRHVWLTKTHPLHIAKWGTFVRSERRGQGAHVSINTELLNESEAGVSGHVISRILDHTGKLVAPVPTKPFTVSPRGNLTVETQVSLAQAALWSLDEPNLYRVVTQIESGGKVTDHDDATFGIRSIRFDPDHGFFPNEKPVKIKGTCNHQDHAGMGIAVPDRIHYDRVAVMRQMGSNAWRTAHNPVSAEFLDACDSQGMMVMSEVRMMASTPEGLSELERMVRSGRNHPSIVIWSLANEEYFYQGTPTGARIVSTMKALAKKLDPTRPVTGAMNGGWGGKGMSTVLDVQGFNYWNGGMPDEKHAGRPDLPVYTDIDNFHKQFPKLPSLGSETTNGSGTRGIYEDDPKRGYVTPYVIKSASPSIAETWWKVFDERAFLAGGFTWVGFDYRGEPNPYDHISISSQSGIVDTCGFPKDVYYYYKSWWGSEPVLHLFPHWNWTGKEGQDIDVWCYSNLEAVELFLNGKSLGSKPVVRNSHVHWTVKYEPGTIEVRGSQNGQLALVERRETTGAPARLVLHASLSKIAADGQDVSAIAVEVHDSQGRVMPLASNKVRFKLTGPGKIIGVGNGDPSCHEDDKPDSPDTAVRSAFNGLGMVFVQASKQAGTLQLEASADGLESAKVVIQSNAAKSRPSVD